ncbi:hypothetical protein [Cryptosporangium sp. NPDC048952]|uniref:hypothetical protein n=1 Tax=Cryptosporangium sp. NPDC048952 TaxID=3363961 RepID=UPI00371D7677
MSGLFFGAAHDTPGASWLEDLAAASVAAAETKFARGAGKDSFLRIDFLGKHQIEAHASYLVTKAVQDATAKLGHVIRDPRTETLRVNAGDRDKARLIQRAQAGNMIVFSFPEADVNGDDYLPDSRVETLSELAARELVNILPSSAEDDASLDAVLGQRQTVRNAVNDMVDAVRKTSSLEFSFFPTFGEMVGSILSVDQADALHNSLQEIRTDRRTVSISGRLDGVRTKRRIFYLEPDSGGDVQGALGPELLEDIRANLDKRVTAVLEEELVQTRAGRRSRPVYRLVGLTPSG